MSGGLLAFEVILVVGAYMYISRLLSRVENNKEVAIREEIGKNVEEQKNAVLSKQLDVLTDNHRPTAADKLRSGDF